MTSRGWKQPFHTTESKKDLLFLHGWGGNKSSWLPITERLKEKFRIHVLDLPGFGESVLTKPYQLADYANFVMDFLKSEKVEKPIIVGHSFGGRVAIKVITNFPSVAAGLVLVNSAGISTKYGDKHYLWLAITKTGKFFLSLPFVKNLYQPVKKLFYKARKLEQSDYFNIENENLKKTFINIIDEDLSEDISKIKLPTLIIWGEKDQETPLEDGQTIHRLIKGSKMIVFPSAGHFSYLDDQERFCQELETFAYDAN